MSTAIQGIRRQLLLFPIEALKSFLYPVLLIGSALVPGLAAASDLAIVGAKVYPAPDRAAIADAVVLMRGDRIVAVGSRDQVPIPAGVTVINATGEVVTAGFWNNHVHLLPSGLIHPESLSNSNLSATLQSMFTRWGFTTIFDLASTMVSANTIRDRIAAGDVAGPTILTVGEPFFPPKGTPVYAQPIYRSDHLPSAEITSNAEAVARVDQQAKEGANGIKLFTGAIEKTGQIYMSADAVKAITGEAHRLGLQTFAHPTDAKGADLAVDNGVDILAHADALGGPWSSAFVAKLRRRNVGLIPTLMLFTAEPDPRTPISTALQQVKAQAESGGDILFGTDAGFIEIYDPTEEYRLMARVLDWKAILASLTTTPARRFGQAAHVGRVQPGFDADLVILAGDPAVDAANLALVDRVVRHGVVIYTAVKQTSGKASIP